jgi:hypothetical protein
MERKITITYRWWSNDDKPIADASLIEVLEEAAMSRIFSQIKAGYTSGELVEDVRMTDDDPEDGIEYRGYWELTTEVA